MIRHGKQFRQVSVAKLTYARIYSWDAPYNLCDTQEIRARIQARASQIWCGIIRVRGGEIYCISVPIHNDSVAEQLIRFDKLAVEVTITKRRPLRLLETEDLSLC